MILFILSVFFLTQELVESNRESPKCPPDPDSTGLVDNCNHWCWDGEKWENRYYPVDTKCKYDTTHTGTCKTYPGEKGTACTNDEDGNDHNPDLVVTYPNEGGETTTTQPIRKKRDEKKKEKKDKKKKKKKGSKKVKNSTSTKPSRKPKKESSKKKQTTAVVEW
uniref:Basic tail secreted protein n=1 Tax=Rhipicephalus zambeziensis TaxID=60191 RepID=A0A224Y1Q1_9ACAR